MVDGLETITYYKHHYVRKTGLKREIKKLFLKTLTETEQIQILDDWLIKGKYDERWYVDMDKVVWDVCSGGVCGRLPFL